jgi:hypothetical protein
VIARGLTVGDGAELMAKVRELDVLLQFVTETVALPAVAMSVVEIEALSFVELITVVARCAPFQSTTDRLLKPDPVTVRVNALPPAIADDGESDDTTVVAWAIVVPHPTKTPKATTMSANLPIFVRINNHLSSKTH